MATLLYSYVQKKRASRRQGIGRFNVYISPVNEPPNSNLIQAGASPIVGHGPKHETDLVSFPTNVSDDRGLPQRSEGDVLPDEKDESGPVVEAHLAELERIKQEKRSMRVYRWKLIFGLFLPFSIQALETTVLAGAYPFIASDFGEFHASSHETMLTIFKPSSVS